MLAVWQILNKRFSFPRSDLNVIASDTLAAPDLVNEYFYMAKYFSKDSCIFPFSYSTHSGGTLMVKSIASGGLIIYPNPSIEEFIIQNDSAFTTGARADVYDVSGRLIHSYPLRGNDTSYPFIKLPARSYTTAEYTVIRVYWE